MLKVIIKGGVAVKNNSVFQRFKNIYKHFVYIIVAAVLVISNPAFVFATPSFSNYSTSSGYKDISQVRTANGSFWYLEVPTSGSDYTHIGKMTTAGVTTDYDIPTLTGSAGLKLSSLTVGLDGNIWFNGKISSTPRVGVLNVTTGAATLYSAGPGTLATYNAPGRLLTGSDGNLYFYVKTATSPAYTYIAYTNPSTGTTSIAYTLYDTDANLTDMTIGPDGKLWFTDNGAYQKKVESRPLVGGSGSASYTLPSTYTSPYRITSGADGNLWVTASYTSGGAGVTLKLTTSGTFTEYVPPTGMTTGVPIAGTDGAKWFTAYQGGANKIGRMTSSGNVTTYTIPGSSITSVGGIIVGPDDAIWFTYQDSGGWKLGRLVVTPDFSNYSISSSYANPGQVTKVGSSLYYLETTATNPSYYTHIGKMTTSGTTTDYNIRTLSGYANFGLTSLTAGPDGNVWFNGKDSTSVYTGSLNVSTGAVTLYSSFQSSYSSPGSILTGSDGNLYYYIKSAGAPAYTYIVYLNPSTGATNVANTISDTSANLTDMTIGPDGKLWYTDNGTYQKKVESRPLAGGSGGVSYTLPSTYTSPYRITLGTDGNLWVTASYTSGGAGVVLKLTTSGTFTEYVPPTGMTTSVPIAGPDGAKWFNAYQSGTNKIGRMTSSGNVTTYTIPGSSITNVGNIVVGPDDAIWFAYMDSGGWKLGRLGY